MKKGNKEDSYEGKYKGRKEEKKEFRANSKWLFEPFKGT